jgi:hypothetical protein
MSTTRLAQIGDYVRGELGRAVLTPVRELRLVYLPLLMIYFSYGALGLTAVADSFWIKKELTLTPANLASIAVWLTLPWTIKMVFGELVDTVALLGSRRRVYVFIGAGLMAAGFLLLAGSAGRWITIARPEAIYVAASMLIVTGAVLQDVVADAMSTEVVPRREPDGSPRLVEAIERDLAMVQVLGRIALALGVFSVAGLGGWLAQHLAYEKVFLLGLAVPAISVTGALLVELEPGEPRATDWQILGGGIAFGVLVTLIALLGVPLGQEIVLVVSLAVVLYMLSRVTGEMAPETRRAIAFAALIIFAFRATPAIGQGYQWFAIDRLGFDEAFFGVLGQTGAAFALVAGWLLADLVTRQPMTRVLFWLIVLGTVMSLPNLALVLGLHEWTGRVLGIGARSIALADTAAQSPLDQVSMIPLLTLIAVYAPARHRATWFALMASFMNLALVAGQLGTKYLNLLLPVDRGQYEKLPALTLTVIVIGLVVPLAALLLFGRKLRPPGATGG